MRYKKSIYNYILTVFFVLTFGYLAIGISQNRDDDLREKRNLDDRIYKNPNIKEYNYMFYCAEKDMTIEELSVRVKQDKNILRYNNPFLVEKIRISKGDKILVYDRNIIIYKMKEKEKLENVLKKFNITMKNVKKKGSGRYGVNYLIIENPNITDEELENQQKERLDNFYINLKEVKYVQREETKKNSEIIMNSSVSTDELYWPVGSFRITSFYGRRKHPILRVVKFHTGIDIAAPIGTSVISSIDGEVNYSGYRGGYGKFIEIKNENGMITDYGHLSKIFVKKGDKIKKGDLIGMVGNTGFSTGPHLHFEIKENNMLRNPLEYRYNKKIGA